MKLPVVNLAKRSMLCGLVAVGLSFGINIGSLCAQVDSNAGSDSTAASTASPLSSPADAKANKKPKKSRRPDEATPTPKVKNPKEIPFPLPINEPANGIKLPETDQQGNLLSQILAAKATRIDNEHVKMEEMKMDLNHPDGKEDFHVILPTSIFNLKTRIITSNDPVTVQTQDFELTGDGMEFNTIDRTGRLLGKVRMLIHNLKQVAGQAQPAPKSE